MVLTNVVFDTEPELYYQRLSLVDVYKILTANNWTKMHKDAITVVTADCQCMGVENGTVKITRRNCKNSVKIETVINAEYDK